MDNFYKCAVCGGELKYKVRMSDGWGYYVCPHCSLIFEEETLQKTQG